MSRLEDLRRFYEILSDIEVGCGGIRRLAECHGRMNWPRRGVYFLFESGEVRKESGTGLRVVRVGTHAVSGGSKSTLWKRLAQHRGKSDGSGGNHRGSVFRLLVGAALASREPETAAVLWGTGQSAPKPVREAETALEARVSSHIGGMPFLWLECDDDPSPDSRRAYIERNSIALLSQVNMHPPLDSPSGTWLGSSSPNPDVCKSGLWNSRHVRDNYDNNFIDLLGRFFAGRCA